MYFLIEETLREISAQEIRKSGKQYVAVLSFEEWKERRDSFDMGIDMDLNDS